MINTTQQQFIDSVFGVRDLADPSKLGQFDVSAISTGIARVLAFPNASGTIATQEWTSANFLSLDGTTGPMTGTLDMGDNPIVDIDHLDFNLVNGIECVEGRMCWNDEDGTVNLGMKGGVVKQQIGLETLLRGKNTVGSTVADGSPIRVSGASGNNPEFGLSKANDPAAAGCIGLTTETFATTGDSQFGYATTFGLVRDIDTTGTPVGETWNILDRLYVSNTAGKLTKVPPTGTERIIFVGIVLVANATVGVILANIINVSYLSELSGVTITSVADMDILKYESSSGIWKNSDFLKITTSPGVLKAVTVSDDGVREVSWTAGEIVDFSGNIVVTEAGSGTCTDNAENQLVWASGTTLTLSTSSVTSTQIPIAHIAVAANDIWEIHTESLLDVLLHDIQHGLGEAIPLLVVNGLVVQEDADATNPLDVSISAGEYYHDLHSEHPVTAKDSRTVALRRWYHSGGVWTSDTNAEIDNTQYDNGTNLVGMTPARYFRSLFLTSETEIHWIYPQEQFTTLAGAIAGADPTIPAGLTSFPKCTVVIMRQGDTVFPTAGSDRWIDVRPVIGAGGSASTINDHGSLSGLGDAEDHVNYLTLDGTRAMSGDLDMGTSSITADGDLKIVPDATGDVILFGDIDVDDASVGKSLIVYRKAVEGDSYLQINGTGSQNMSVESFGGQLLLRSTLGVHLNDKATSSSSNQGVNCFASVLEGVTPLFEIGGYPTGGSFDTVSMGFDPSTAGKFNFTGAGDSYTFDNKIEVEIIESTTSLKLNPDSPGAIHCFNGADIGDAVTGSAFNIHRKAVEGDRVLQFYISSAQRAVINTDASTLQLTSAGDLRIGSASGGIRLEENANGNITCFQTTDIGGSEGKSFYIYKKDASGGDSFWRTYGSTTGKIITVTNGGLRVMRGGGRDMEIYDLADANVKFFSGAASGEVPYVQISGQGTGLSQVDMQMAVDNTVEGQFNFTGAGSYSFDNDIEITGTVKITALPTSDPSDAGALWNSSGTVMVSAG